MFVNDRLLTHVISWKKVRQTWRLQWDISASGQLMINRIIIFRFNNSRAPTHGIQIISITIIYQFLKYCILQ